MSKPIIIIGGIILVLIMWNVLFGKKNHDLDKDLDLKTLHSNTVPAFPNNAPALFSMFDDNKKVVIIDERVKAKQLFFFDLENNATKELELHSNTQLNTPTLIPADKEVLVVYNTNSEDNKQKAYKIDALGNIKELKTLDLILYTVDDYASIAEEAALMNDLLKEGRLDNLTRINTKYFKNVNTQDTVPEGYFNNEYYIAINEANNRDQSLLQAKVKNTITNDYVTKQKTLKHKDITVEVTYKPFEEYAGVIDNQNITNVKILKQGKELKNYTFQNFYYNVVIFNDTLYIVGQNIKMLDLNSI